MQPPTQSWAVVLQRRKEKQFLPGSDTYYVEFCEFDRVGRDEVGAAVPVGGRRLGDALLRHGVSDFLLPSEQGDLKYTNTEDDWRAYNNLGIDLDKWMGDGVMKLNRLRAQDQSEDEDRLGNSGSSPDACSAGSSASGSASDAPEKPDSLTSS